MSASERTLASCPVPMPASAAIETDALRKAYGTRVAVDGLSLKVRTGRIFGFLGPNGAGKTTTMGCLTGVLRPSSGAIRLLGEPMTPDSAALKRQIGVMPQDLALFDQLYAHELLLFTADVYGVEAALAKARIGELLLAMDLATERVKRLADFSTGMRKKVAFAAAVIHAPEILFLDEPFEGIDPQGVAMLKQWLRRYVERGRTVFMTSHIMETVERFCDEVAIIKDGQVVWRSEGRPLERPELDGQAFETLEALFLHVTGGTSPPLEWL